MKIKTFSLGDLVVNCYLLFEESIKEAVIIDAPYGIESVLEYLNDKGLKLLAVFLTHGHIDHIYGLGNINVPFYIHRNDESFLHTPDLNLSSFLGKPFVLKGEPTLIEEGDFSLGSFSFKVLHTPGHTPGSLSFLINNWLFSGDALFLNSVGRTDFVYASHETLIASIKEKVTTLKPKTVVFPGHGDSTTVEYERLNNPFLTGV
ncbi:MAG: MBL fold metallo-hydrolase [Candidatus Omnitrophota bacterium]